MIRSRLPRVLIIDDRPSTVEFLQVALGKMATCLVSIARTPDEGMRMALQLRPDLIVCDLKFNGEDGLQLGARLSADPRLKNIRKVLYTDKPLEDGDREKAKAAGFLDYIRKPLDPWEHAASIMVHVPARKTL